jgi:2-amino-4-hydroxy-6-hydroxymethyldihydropteridine diphosphokinase
MKSTASASASASASSSVNRTAGSSASTSAEMTHVGKCAYIALGSNLGNSQATIRRAIIELDKLPSTKLIRSSSLYLSAPIDAEGDSYVNAVVELDTKLNPEELLSELHTVENRFGRTRHYQNAPRTLDLDLLLYEQLILSTDKLQIPHPRLTQRAFVLLPLIEIASEVSIPSFGSAQSLLAGLPHQAIQRIK